MTEQQTPHEQHAFQPNPEFATQALREEVIEERERNASLRDRLSYLRAVNLQMQTEAQQEIARRDSIIESLRASRTGEPGSVGTEGDPTSSGPHEPTQDELDPATVAEVEQSLDSSVSTPPAPEGKVSHDVSPGLVGLDEKVPRLRKGPHVQVEQPRDLTADDAEMERDGEAAPIPDFPEGLAPDATADQLDGFLASRR